MKAFTFDLAKKPEYKNNELVGERERTLSDLVSDLRSDDDNFRYITRTIDGKNYEGVRDWDDEVLVSKDYPWKDLVLTWLRTKYKWSFGRLISDGVLVISEVEV